MAAAEGRHRTCGPVGIKERYTLMMSSLYIGATGLKSHSKGMSVITDNLANVNTVAYKQMSMQYSDLMSQYLTTPSNTMTNISQKGMGAVPGSIRTLFVQGGFEKGATATDIGINGIGFFAVTNGTATHYTRAGNFRFDKSGALLDPSGWNLMGRAIDGGVESTTVMPVKLDLSVNGHGYMAPQATTKVSVGAHLGGLEDKMQNTANPFFAMASAYNGESSTPLGSGQYGYGEPIQFYDSSGILRQGTIYYDKAGESGGLTSVEYVVAMNPSEDGSALADTKAAGLLMAGTLTFSSNGQIAGMTAFYPPSSGDPSDLSAWTPAAMKDGQPVLNIQPAGAAAQSVTLDMGFKFTGGGASASAGAGSAAELAADSSKVYRNETAKELSGNASDMYGTSVGSFYANRDGYAPGELLEVTVTEDGILRGRYSNGQTEDLFRITLYRFTSQDGLRNEGNNHYSATKESGAAEEGIPGDENFGTLAEWSLEQSNVDYAREFSLMIVTQRGFQMNSKVITTTDTMLQKALELKR